MHTFSKIKLNSRYIPVDSLNSNTGWTDTNSEFYYPYVLYNLAQFKGHKSEYGIDDDIFLLTDSGGFQVISGTCNYTWEESLKQQLMIGATRIFSFDIPPLVKKSENSAGFNYKNFKESIKRSLKN